MQKTNKSPLFDTLSECLVNVTIMNERNFADLVLCLLIKFI